MSRPDDLGALDMLIKEKGIKADEIIAIIAKTEGNGNVNDFTRGFTTFALQSYLSEHIGCTRDAVMNEISIVCSGGCEGVLSPHATVFARIKGSTVTSDAKSGSEKRLAVAVKHTRNLLPEEIGTSLHAREVGKAVKEAVADAGIEDQRDVHFVQIKCPLLTSDRINDAEGRGKKVVTKDTLKSMAYSRGASALGVALALKEIDDKKVTDEAICNDWSLFSNVASTSAGVELMNNEIVAMGNSAISASNYVIGHSVMADMIDVDAVWAALQNVGIEGNKNNDNDSGARSFTTRLSRRDSDRVVNVFAKAGPHPNGLVRGRRTTMLTDSDISSTRHARAGVSAVIASIVGDPMIYVSGGSEHQGQLGGGPIAVIARV